MAFDIDLLQQDIRQEERMKTNKKIFIVATKIFLRRESFGGLLFVPITGEIVQLNQAAFNLVEKLVQCGSIAARSKDLPFWQKLREKNLVKEVS